MSYDDEGSSCCKKERQLLFVTESSDSKYNSSTLLKQFGVVTVNNI